MSETVIVAIITGLSGALGALVGAGVTVWREAANRRAERLDKQNQEQHERLAKLISGLLKSSRIDQGERFREQVIRHDALDYIATLPRGSEKQAEYVRLQAEEIIKAPHKEREKMAADFAAHMFAVRRGDAKI